MKATFKATVYLHSDGLYSIGLGHADPVKSIILDVREMVHRHLPERTRGSVMRMAGDSRSAGSQKVMKELFKFNNPI